MAAGLDMLQACKDYAKGGWAWGHRDCIGLMICLLRKCTGKHIRLSDYMPVGLDYHASVDWLVKNNELALFPYFHLLDQDLQLPRSKPGDDGHLILLLGGQPLHTSTGELYPIAPVPGIAFKPPGKQPLVFGRKGLVTTSIPSNIKYIVRYDLPGVR